MTAPIIPKRWTRTERHLLKAASGKEIERPDQPAFVRNEYPEWIEPLLQRQFGDQMAAEMHAAIGEANTDLRVNTLKATREEAIAAMKAEGIKPLATALSPIGLRVHGRPALAALQCFKDGLIEVQDEGSQLVGLLVDARPGMRVVDFCAGAGGKTLAIAAQMKNKGKIFACDVLQGRVDRAAVRFNRAGVFNVERKGLSQRARPLGQAPRRQLRPRAGRCALYGHRHLAPQPRRQVETLAAGSG